MTLRPKNIFYDKDGRTTYVDYYAEGEYEAIQLKEQELIDYNTALSTCFNNRQNAYRQKGWYSEFDVFDDMMKRGIEVVLEERRLIKESFPKPTTPW